METSLCKSFKSYNDVLHVTSTSRQYNMDASGKTTGDEAGGSVQQTSSGMSSVWKYFTKDENTITCKICKSVTIAHSEINHIICPCTKKTHTMKWKQKA